MLLLFPYWLELFVIAKVTGHLHVSWWFVIYAGLLDMWAFGKEREIRNSL